MWVWETLIGKMHVMKPPARWVSQVIGLTNIWKHIFPFFLCRGLAFPHPAVVPVVIRSSWLSSSGCLNRPSTRSLSLTQGLKGFLAIFCSRQSLCYQVVSLLRILTGVCSASLLLFSLLQVAHCPSAGVAWPWALWDTSPVDFLTHPFPDFINETSKPPLFSWAYLIPPP